MQVFMAFVSEQPLECVHAVMPAEPGPCAGVTIGAQCQTVSLHASLY
jgi:hypothetical protein